MVTKKKEEKKGKWYQKLWNLQWALRTAWHKEENEKKERRKKKSEWEVAKDNDGSMDVIIWRDVEVVKVTWISFLRYSVL